jgi:hypothetical protein
MMKFRLIVVGVLSIIFFTTAASLAATAIKKSGANITATSTASSSSSPAKLFKTTVIVTKLEYSTLYASNGQKYDLRGAKVNNYAAGRKNKTDNIITAELMYVNNVLKEVTIR